MAYDFNGQLNSLVESREKAESVQDLHQVLSRFPWYKARAAQANNTQAFFNACIQEAITATHLYERSEWPLYLDYAFGFAQHALTLALAKNFEFTFVAQAQRRMGDYFHEVGKYDLALERYRKADQGDPDNPEYISTVAREVILSNIGNVEQAVTDLERAVGLASVKKGKIPDWHWLIIMSGVLMKRAEAIKHLYGTNGLVESLMDQAHKHAEDLDVLGYHQRLIQWNRLAKKLDISKAMT